MSDAAPVSDASPVARKGRISNEAIRETLAALGVIGSLAFVGIQISISNTQARAAAYQAIGIATSEFHRSFDAHLNRLITESAYPQALKRWSLADWEHFSRMSKADLRMLETVQLQVEQGLLPADALSRLGYDWGESLNSEDLAFVCLWPTLRRQLGVGVRQLIEDSTPAARRGVCPVDLDQLRERTILGPGAEPSESGDSVSQPDAILVPPTNSATDAGSWTDDGWRFRSRPAHSGGKRRSRTGRPLLRNLVQNLAGKSGLL